MNLFSRVVPFAMGTLTLMAFVLCGCATPRVSSTADYMLSARYQERKEIQGSLFPSDLALLSNEDIQRILTGRIALPSEGRMAILRFGGRGFWSTWSEEFGRIDEQTIRNFVEKLRACPRLKDVSILPSLLTPEKQGVAHLREAAARFQADLLLVYRTSSESYRKYRLLGKEETRAYCTVEAVLLDVRTGIVPFTSLAVEQYTAKESAEDLSFSETVRKAELEAIGRALLTIADDLVAFLNAVP